MINFSGATNIPWAAITSNIHPSGYIEVNFQNTNLRGFNPTGKDISGTMLPILSRDSAGFEIATRNIPGPGTMFLNGSFPWGP